MAIHKFTLRYKTLEIGKLNFGNGFWEFAYTEEFKTSHHLLFNRIIGFPDLTKVYKKNSLWPFFLVRIPGLKQPAIEEIIEKENIDTENEARITKTIWPKVNLKSL